MNRFDKYFMRPRLVVSCERASVDVRGHASIIAAFACCCLLLLLALPAQAAIELRTFIDSDNDPGTGCTVLTPEGSVSGIDQASVTQVDLTGGTAGSVSREICVGGVLVDDAGFVPLLPGQWPLGVAAVQPQIDVVESYARLEDGSGSVRLGFAASTTDNSLPPSALLTINGGSGGGAIVLASSAPAAIPVLGLGGGLLLALLLVALAQRSAHVRRVTIGASALALVLVVSWSWAAIVRDGSPSDWSGVAPLASAPSSAPLDIAAVYALREGATLHLRYDLDLGVRAGVPSDDGPYAVTTGSVLSVPAPGVLDNDVLGTPPMQVREFRMQGSGVSVPAGGSLPFAGGSLTLSADGASA